MFRKNLSLKQLLQGAAATFRRFPLTLLSAITGTAVAITFAEIDYQFKDQYRFLEKMAWLSWLGLILFFVLQLVSEKYKFTSKRKLLWNLAGISFLAGLYVSLPAELLPKHHIHLFLLGLSLHLAASFAPFFYPETENGFWQFNEKLFLRFLTSALYSAILFIGLALAITAVQELFQIRFTFQIHADLWFVLAGIFNTWFFLAGVPQNFEALETETAYPKGLKVFTQFVLLPLVTVYLLILYGYMGKIIFQWEWPRGWVSNLVLGFSIAGIFSLLLIHPIRNASENTWIRKYAKWFYRALFPLLILFGLAIWRRVSDYGITEERYFVLVLAFWLLAVALYFLFSRQKNIKFIPFTLSVLASLVAFGPWGAFSVSQRSQTNRLRHYFQKNSMLSGEKVVPAKTEVPPKDEAEISSILDYLERMHRYESVKPWFGVRLDTMLARTDTMVYKPNVTENLVKSLGLTYRPFYNRDILNEQSQFHFTVLEQELQQVSGYDYIFPYYYYGMGRNMSFLRRFELKGQEFKVDVIVGRPELKFWFEADTALLNLKAEIQKFRENQINELEDGKHYILQVGKARVKVELISLSGRIESKKPILENLNVNILVKLPDSLNSVSER